MRLARYSKLLKNFYRSAQPFDNGFGLLAHGIHLESDFSLHFTVAEDLNQRGLTDQPINIEIFRSEFLQLIFFNQVVDLAKIENVVRNTMRILKASFGKPSLDRHLPSFMSSSVFKAGTALMPLISLCRSSALTGCFASSQTLFLVRRAFCWPDAM